MSTTPSRERFTRMPRGDGEGLLSGAARRLSRIKIPFKSPSLLDRSQPYFSGIKRFGLSKFQHYWQDPFHTLLNLPWGRFIIIFFLTYLIEFMVFAFIFWAQSDRCIIGMEGKFAHALWMSSRTASTLGFDQIHPNPACTLTNLTIMLQVIASSLVNFIMLGLVFARFSAPFKRATTIRFSSVMVAFRHPTSGHWCLSLRVANIRKHQLLKPSLRMVMTAVDSITPSNYLFEHLAIEGLSTQVRARERLASDTTTVIAPFFAYSAGLPLVLKPHDAHLSRPHTDPDDLNTRAAPLLLSRPPQILMFVDGIDAMTSKNMTARHAYNTNEVHMNEQFLPLHLEMRGSAMGLDFTSFDSTALASVELLAEHNADPSLADLPLPELQSHMWHLRHMTFKRLTERDPAAAATPSSANSASAAPWGPHPLAPGSGGGGAGPSTSTSAPASGGALPPRGPAAPPAPHPLHTSGKPDGAGHLPAAAGGAAASGNPFASTSSAGGGAAAGSAGGHGGGAASWMGFGVSLQGAPAAAAAGGHGPLPISAFLNSAHSGLESFADKHPPPPHQQQHHHLPQGQQHGLAGQGGQYGGSGGGGGGGAYAQRSWAPGGGGGAAAPMMAAPPAHPHPRGLMGQGFASASGDAAGGAAGVEMLPTSSPAGEPRVNGGTAGGG
ncbi:ATP-sensitive inward rectifier potassium channel 11, partial [Tetrabaena socialis]